MIFIKENMALIVIGLMILSLILLILSLVTVSLNRKLMRQYKNLTNLTGEEGLMEILIENQQMIKILNEKEDHMNRALKQVEKNLRKTYQKMAIVKYNAFEGLGGQLSTVIVLINKENSGLLLNSIHTNTGGHMYSKTIIKGKTEKNLSEEEKAAIEEAINQK